MDYQGAREIADTETFVRSCRRYLRPFLEKVAETQAFSEFAINIGKAGDFAQFKSFAEMKLAKRSNSQSIFRRTFSWRLSVFLKSNAEYFSKNRTDERLGYSSKVNDLNHHGRAWNTQHTVMCPFILCAPLLYVPLYYKYMRPFIICALFIYTPLFYVPLYYGVIFRVYSPTAVVSAILVVKFTPKLIKSSSMYS